VADALDLDKLEARLIFAATSARDIVDPAGELGYCAGKALDLLAELRRLRSNRHLRRAVTVYLKAGGLTWCEWCFDLPATWEGDCLGACDRCVAKARSEFPDDEWTRLPDANERLALTAFDDQPAGPAATCNKCCDSGFVAVADEKSDSAESAEGRGR
jgi:hypothetical protein